MSFGVEGFDRPSYNMERVGIIGSSFGARRATDLAIQSAISAETWVSSADTFLAEFVEEHVQCGLSTARSGPDETASVVVNHAKQITVSKVVGDLIHSIRRRPERRCNLGLNIIVDSGDDRPDSPTQAHPKELPGRTLRSSGQKATTPIATKSRVWPAPCLDHRTFTTVRAWDRPLEDPWSVDFDKRLWTCPQLEPPASPAVAAVIAW